jgi:hypothetical protein
LRSTQPIYRRRVTEMRATPKAIKKAVDFRRPGTTMLLC